jgi:CMP-N,N'-diacetyllegionaminic acid synthase
MKFLFVIPARGGSKGIPGKNIKPLLGKPLIWYSLEFARLFDNDENICVTTDSMEIVSSVKQLGYNISFLRPPHLATDNAGSYEMMLHALDEYEKKNGSYDVMVLLQPTSPFRKKKHLVQAIELLKSDTDMVVSVKESEANPYYNLFEKNSKGFLQQSKEGNYDRRQDCPPVYQYNGSLYVIRISSLKKSQLNKFKAIVPYVMTEEYSIDLDTPIDWILAENIGKVLLG